MKEYDFEKMLNNVNISEEMQNEILQKVKNTNYEKRRKNMKFRKKLIPAALAATLLLGMTAFAATHINWSKGFLQSLKIFEKQMEALQDSKNSLVSTPDVSVTKDDITVSVAQCLCDGNTLKISFYVEGYELEKTKEPQLQYLNILIDGKEVSNYAWQFFNGIDWSDKSNIKMADGSPLEIDEGGRYIPNYRISDGKMELNLTVFSPQNDDGKMTKEDFENKEIEIIMQNFGNKKGKWTLKWNLGNLEDGKEIFLNKKVGNTKATVTSVTLYPTSAIIRFDFPKIKIEEEVVDENGKIEICTDYKEAPVFEGVKLKDNTVYTDMANGGSDGFEKDNEYVSRINFSRIIDINEVKAIILFDDGKQYEIPLE